MERELLDVVIHVVNQQRSQNTKLQQLVEKAVKVDKKCHKHIFFLGDNKDERDGSPLWKEPTASVWNDTFASMEKSK